MSSDNVSSAVTYTSVSSDSNKPSSWGIPLVNAGELPEMDPYEEVAQQGQAHPLSPAYVPDPMELDEHVPVYVPEPEHLDYHVPSDDDIQAENQPYANDASPTAKSPGYIADLDSMENDTDTDLIDYPDESGTDDEDPEDEDEDPEEDPSEEHNLEDEDEDPEEDPNEEHKPEDEDEPSEDSDKTEPFEENETAATPPPPRSPQTRVPFSQTRLRRAWKTVRPEPPMPASMEARIAEHAATPIPPTSPTYDQAPLGHRAAMIRMRDDIPEEDMPPRRRFVLTAPPPGCDVAESSAAAARAPRRQYDFVDAVEAGQGLICGPGHDARTFARAADRAEDVGTGSLDDARYDRALLRARVNMLESDRPFHGRTAILMEEEARLSRAAWAQSMDVCDQTHSEGILLRTTVMTQQSEIVELRAADQRRQTVISELLKADYRRQRQLVETLKIVKSLKAQMTELQRQQGPAKDPAEPELPEEAGSST
ncbi:hypothetical protein Tco_1314129 [Tanacetum coccineum]